MTTSNNMTYDPVPKPKVYSGNFEMRDQLLMIPGPTNMHPRVLKALSTPILAHTDQQFYELLRQIQVGLCYLFQTRNRYTFALTGSATLAMETAVCNLLTPGQRLLSLVHGHWGERAAWMGERLGVTVRRESVPIGEIFTLNQVENALRTFRPQLMYVCHGDSSLGTLQPLEGLGDLCHRYDCLLLVDAVVSLCTAPLSMDALGIDVLYAGAQKALSGPPGVALISLSDRAMATVRRRAKAKPISSYYMDLEWVAKAWGLDNQGIYAYHYTHAINLLYGLREAIQLVVEQGIENIIKRHRVAKAHLENRLLEIGLECLIPRPCRRLPGIMSVIIPDGIDGARVMAYLYNRHRISIGGSLLAASLGLPRFWRIGYLGVNADVAKVDQTIDALREAIFEQRSLKAKL